MHEYARASKIYPCIVAFALSLAAEAAMPDTFPGFKHLVCQSQRNPKIRFLYYMKLSTGREGGRFLSMTCWVGNISCARYGVGG